MPDINVDFTSVEADEFSMVPPGEYDCTIASVKYGQKEQTGEDETFPYLNIDMVIDEGQDWAGSHLYYISSFSPKGGNMAPARRTKFLLLTLGVDLTAKQKWTVDDENKLLIPNLVGKPVHVRTITGKNGLTGEPQPRIVRIKGNNPVGEGASATASAGGKYK